MLVTLLQESYGLPDIVANPSTKDYKRFEAMVGLQTSLLDQVKKVSIWVAQSHDMLSGAPHMRMPLLGKGDHAVLEQHITRSKLLAVKPPGIDALTHSANAIRSWKERASTIIENARQGTERCALQAIQGLIDEASRLAHTPTELAALQRMVTETRGMAAHLRRVFPYVTWSPFSRPAVTAVARKASTAAAGSSRKMSLDMLRYLHKYASSCPADYLECRRLGEHIAAAEDWITRCEEAVGKDAQDLKVLASLASESENVPVDLSAHVEKLASAITLAQDWMSRVQSAVPRSSKTRKGKGEDTVDLATLKSLLVEGAASAHSGGKNDSKNALSNVRVIVDKADEWLSRSQAALASRVGVETEALEALLREGNDIPVSMVETCLLQVEVDSREWSERARYATDAQRPEAKRAAHSDLLELLDEADTIRASLPEAAQAAHVIEGEAEIRRLEIASREWNLRADSCFGSNVQAPLVTLKELHAEGVKYPLDMEGRMQRISKSIAAATEWVASASQVIARVRSDIKSRMDTREEMVWTHEAVVRATDAEFAASAAPPLMLKDLATLINDVRNLGVSTPEEKTLQEYVDGVQEWLEKAKSMLPKKQRKKAGDYQKPSMANYTQTCEQSRELAIPCTTIVLKLCAEMDESRGWLARAQSLLEDSDMAMSKALDAVATVNGEDDDSDPQMDTVRRFYEDYIDMRKEADTSLAVSSPEEGLLNLRIATAEWAESADTALQHAEADNLPLEVAHRLRDEGQALWDRDHSFGPWPSCSPVGSDKGGWRMKTHAVLLDRVKAAAAAGQTATTAIAAIMKGLGPRKNRKVQQPLSTATSEQQQNAHSLEALEKVLLDANSANCIDVKLFGTFKIHLRKCRAAAEAAEKLFAETSEKPSIEQVRTVLEQMAALNLSLPCWAVLDRAFKTATSWETRLRQSGIETGLAPVELLRKLLEESKSIPVDLSAHVQVLEAATTEYCLCRGPSDGWMIGCEDCDDWFHGRCVGLQESDEVDNYICPRCSVHAFLKANRAQFLETKAKYLAEPSASVAGSTPNVAAPSSENGVACEAPLGLESITTLLQRAEALLCDPTEVRSDVADLHRNEGKMKLFYEQCQYIRDSCPPCTLTSAVAAWLKLQVWCSSVLTVLNEKPDLAAVTELIKLHGNIYVPPGADASLVLAPLALLVKEGTKWTTRAVEVMRGSWVASGVPTEAQLKEVKGVLDHILNMPVKHEIVPQLRAFYTAAKERLETDKSAQAVSGRKRSRKRPAPSRSRKHSTAKTAKTAPASVAEDEASAPRASGRKHDAISNDCAASAALQPPAKRLKPSPQVKMSVGMCLEVRVSDHSGQPRTFSAVVQE